MEAIYEQYNWRLMTTLNSTYAELEPNNHYHDYSYCKELLIRLNNEMFDFQTITENEYQLLLLNMLCYDALDNETQTTYIPNEVMQQLLKEYIIDVQKHIDMSTEKLVEFINRLIDMVNSY